MHPVATSLSSLSLDFPSLYSTFINCASHSVQASSFNTETFSAFSNNKTIRSHFEHPLKNEKTRQITHCCKKKKAIFKLQSYPTSTLVWSMDLIQEHLYKKRIKHNFIMNEI